MNKNHMKKTDDHMHVSLKPEGRKINGELLASAEEILPVMERHGIGHGVLMSMGENDCQMNNAENREICRRYPERFSYMANFDLMEMDGLEERVIAEKEAGAKGVGEFQMNLTMEDERLWKFLDILERQKMPFLFHMSPEIGKYYGLYDEGGLPGLEKLLNAFPELPVIAHSQPFWYEMISHGSYAPEERNSYPEGRIEKEGRVQELFRKYPNLYGDLSANSGGNAVMRDPEYGVRFLEEFQDRLLYGTDLYCAGQYFPLGDFLDEQVRSGRLSEAAYYKIIRGNAERVLVHRF